MTASNLACLLQVAAGVHLARRRSAAAGAAMWGRRLMVAAKVLPPVARGGRPC
ncbi:MAG TPA: hypothetical protein VNT75_05515 [Symbiobacteriaceae bacterium]|nr:hypothetical protein [Symbiobacteriaceae bacterium]